MPGDRSIKYTHQRIKHTSEAKGSGKHGGDSIVLQEHNVLFFTSWDWEAGQGQRQDYRAILKKKAFQECKRTKTDASLPF